MWVMAHFTRALYVPFDQLHKGHGALKGADKKSDLIVLVESQSMMFAISKRPTL
jgi:deoxyribodipyrimidine photolyase-like uncharacterized protein